jgi:hypothetical protein
MVHRASALWADKMTPGRTLFMEMILSLCVGVGLSAACGFRVFVPLLMMSIATASGHLVLSPGFQWIGSPAALAAFSVATALEIAGYYIPWVDHFLDVVATPAAAVAGTIITASLVTEMSPFLRWTLAVIAGGGAASLVQGATVVARGFSGATTAGMANPLVATLELGGSVVTSVLALVAPALAVLGIVSLLVWVGGKYLRSRSGKSPDSLRKAC